MVPTAFLSYPSHPVEPTLETFLLILPRSFHLSCTLLSEETPLALSCPRGTRSQGLCTFQP